MKSNIIKRDGIVLPGNYIFDEFVFSKEFFILKSGLVAVFQALNDGSRQILRFVLPGEIFGNEPTGAVHHSNTAEAITVTSYCAQSIEILHRFHCENTGFATRYINLLERERLILLNSLTNIGRRDALSRVAYLLMELAVRSSGDYPLVSGHSYRLPLVQRMIADATGLTVIHVNRTLTKLRSEGYLDFHDGKLTVLNSARLDRLVDLGQGAHAALESLKSEGY